MSYSRAASDRFVDMVRRIRKAPLSLFPFPRFPLFELSCLLDHGNVLGVASLPQQSLDVRPQVPEFGRFYTKACAMRKRKRACQCSREIYFSKRQVEASVCARVSATGAVQRNVLKAGRRLPLASTGPVVLAERSSSASGSRACNGGGIDLLAAAAAVAGDVGAPGPIGLASCTGSVQAMQVFSCVEAQGRGE